MSETVVYEPLRGELHRHGSLTHSHPHPGPHTRTTITKTGTGTRMA